MLDRPFGIPAVAGDHGRRLVEDFERDRNPALAATEEVEVLRDSQDFARVVPAQVGPDEVCGDDPRFVAGNARGGKEPFDETA